MAVEIIVVGVFALAAIGRVAWEMAHKPAGEPSSTAAQNDEWMTAIK